MFEPRTADLSPMTPDLGVYARDVQQSIGVNIRNYMKPDRTHSRESFYRPTDPPLIVPLRRDYYRYYLDIVIQVSALCFLRSFCTFPVPIRHSFITISIFRNPRGFDQISFHFSFLPVRRRISSRKKKKRKRKERISRIIVEGGSDRRLAEGSIRQ